MEDYTTIKIDEGHEGISIVVLNRPHRLNAWNAIFLDEMVSYLDSLMRNVHIRVLIITGEGRGFSSGLDLKDHPKVYSNPPYEEYRHLPYTQMDDPKKRDIIFQDILSRLIIKFRQIPQPIIAAVNGPAYGGGFAVTLASDIRIASNSAVFCNAFINIGVSGADCGSTYWLPRLIGFARAAEILYTGREVFAEEAERIGLVSKVVPEGKLMNEALRIAHILLKKSYMGLQMTKEALNMNIDAPSLDSAVKFENRIQNVCGETSDSKGKDPLRLGKKRI